MLDGDSLRVFVTVAEQRSFSKAAANLAIAQSVVSKRLRRLEDQLGSVLIDRRVRSAVKLTRMGELFLPHAAATLAQLARTEQAGRNLARGASGPVRIGFIFSAAMNGVLVALMRALHTALPDVEVRPALMETPEQLEALAGGRLDLGLVRPRPSYPAGCEASMVHAEPLVICLRADHPLAAEPELTPDLLAGHRFIVPQFHEKIGLIDSIHRLATMGRFAVPEIVRTDDFVTAACLAAASDHVSIAPASLAKMALPGIAFRPITGFAYQMDTVLVRHPEAPPAAAHLALTADERLGGAGA